MTLRRRSGWVMLAGSLEILLPIGTARAQSLVTDRPDFTESAAVVGSRRFQLEGGYTFTGDGDGDVDEHALGEILLRVGLGERLEFRLGVNSYTWIDGPDGRDEGFEDSGIGLKWLFAEGERGAAALLAGTTVPTGDDGIGAEAWQPEVKLALTREIGSASLGANVGWGWEEEDDDRLHSGVASITVGLPLGERAGLFLETYGLAAEGAGGEEAYADAGVTRLLSPDLQLDARLGVGLNDEAADWYVGIGAARRW